MDFVIGHGIHLGRQVPLIKRVHQECKWIQVVHTDPEELGMFKNYADSIAKGEKKHQAEVKLCELADQVVAIGPKLEEVFSRYLRFCGKDQDVLTLTPGIFSEFADVPQAAEERGKFRVLVFGRGESEDFYLKGYDIAARAVAELCKHEPHIFKLVFVGAPKGGEGLVSEMLLKEGITLSQLIVRSYKEREQLAVQFCEADLAIMPSRTEGFGLAALEALSAGLPVLVSGNSGFGESLKELPFGSSCVVNSEDASEWAKAIRAIHDKKGKLRLSEAVKLRESYAKKYHWEGECGRLVERMLNIIQDQTVAADNLGEQGPSSVSESVSYPDTTTLQHVVCDFVGSGRENVIQEERPRTYHLTITEGREGLNAVIPEISSEGQSVKKQERRSLHLHPSALPPVKKQRRGTGIRGIIQEERPRTYPLTTTVGRQRLHASIPEISSSRGRSFLKQRRRPLHLRPSTTPSVIEQRRDRSREICRIPSDGRSVLTQGRRSLHLHPSATSLVMKQRLVTDIRTGTQGKQPATKTRQDSLFTSKHSEIATRSESCLEPTQSGNFYAVSSEGRSVKQRRRSLYLHPSITPPVKEQRHDTDIRRVFNDNSVLVKLLRAEYNRRAQLRPLFWDSTIQLPLEKVYTRLKIVSRHRGGNQGETERWSDVIWAEDSRREGICAEAQANKANPCNVFSMLKENKDLMTIVEGSPGIGKTTFCLKLACDWANQSSSAASCPEFELVLLVKCRDIDGDLTEAITEQLFPKDLSKDAREELLRFLEDIENQERVLIILDGLDELAEKSKHYVDDLLHRKRWACCYVLTTTRQEKGIEVRKQPEFVFNLFLQIEGFTEKDSFQYIRRHFKISGPEHSSMGEKLIEEIKENSFLRDLQTNPLNLLLLCIVYEDHEGKLPSSRTNLYQVIVVCLLRRYCARHNVKAGKEDMDLEKQFERDIRCLGKLAWNCLLNDRHSFFEEEFEELESRNEKLVARRLGFVYKEESLKVLKPHHEYCFLHKSFQEFLAASYIALKLRRKNLNVFEHLDFDAVINKFSQVFVFVCGILREEASILFEQIGEKLESDWDWLECREAAANFLIKSWNESGNAEGMASTFCSFMPFPRIVHLLCHHDYKAKDWNLLRVLLFCSRFSKVEAPDEIHLRESSIYPLLQARLRDLPFLRNLKSLQWVFFFECLYGT
ncbi:PREDICTED: uncharacterized protein LOC107343052 isoform X12 [Acropora digitifera]|uniref:uncharacterized protein LOC107343052 isoform X12 n=1 Tax=Acropora digitifera TaxID=70779 RepID=UPI00077A44C0|nr:PREDICTED: uncharacterized protein LOC107343052 isoform X12 [Acropora digitifera]